MIGGVDGGDGSGDRNDSDDDDNCDDNSQPTFIPRITIPTRPTVGERKTGMRRFYRMRAISTDKEEI